MAFFKAGLNLPLERINSIELGGVWVCVWHARRCGLWRALSLASGSGSAVSVAVVGGFQFFQAARGRNLFPRQK